MSTRREFLKHSAAVGGALGLSPLTALAQAEAPRVASAPNAVRAREPLNILILGGTGFTGPEQVEYAIARGHSVTLLNRNRTRPDFFKGRVEQLIGDLNGDVSALEGKKFDVVIDNPTTAPAWVRNAARYLKGNTNHYIFVSTISVSIAATCLMRCTPSSIRHACSPSVAPAASTTTSILEFRVSGRTHPCPDIRIWPPRWPVS